MCLPVFFGLFPPEPQVPITTSTSSSHMLTLIPAHVVSCCQGALCIIMFPSELAKPQSYLGVPWFCLECIGLMLSSVGLQWCSGHGALVFSCRPSIALSSCSPGETRTNINYVGSRMVSICMYILYRYLCYTVHSPNISP